MSVVSFFRRFQIERVRSKYPAGTRVELQFTDDPHTRLVPGDRGTVAFVDDIGTIHIDWDTGSRLGMIPGVDSIRKL